jgi:PAS domain S-box-containing protein
MTQSDGALGDKLHSARESLERSPERFRLIVESIRDYAIFMLDPTGHIVSWNAGAERIKGYKADEIIGKHFSIFYDPAEVAAGKCERELELAARDGRFEDEGWRLRKGGSRFWASVILTALHDPTGRLVGFAKVTRDLTERMLAERARTRLARAEEAQRWLATTLRSIGDAVITTDGEGNVRLMNAAAESLLGVRLDAVRGSRLGGALRIVDAKTRAPIENPVDRVLREGVTVSFGDGVLVRRDGTETPIADSAAPIREEGGAMQGVVVVVRDATAEKLDAARRSFMIDASAVLASSLDEARALSGLAELAVPRVADFCAIDVLDGDRPRRVASAGVAPVPPPPSDALRTGGSVMGPRGAWIAVPLTAATHVLGAITLAFGDSGRAYGPDDLRAAEELGRHVTMALEKARLYYAEQRARQSADSANRAKDEFLAAVSHELRTPLTAILGWSKMITGASLDELQRARAAETIERNAVAMTQLIEDLLDVSRIVSGRMRIDVKRVDLEETLDAALDSVRPALGAKGIHLEKAIDPRASEVRGDASRLQQVVWNLLSNAVKFTPPGGHVRVVLRAANGATDLVVSDDGKGIDPQFMPHVFEAFRQAEGGIVRHAGGLGLGLAITKHIVELHGGTIDVQSGGLGKGATFTVHLPSAAKHRMIETVETPQLVEPGLEPEAQLDGLRVLMVDDEEDARDLVRAVLEHSGSIVTTAPSVKRALEVFREEVPDVLLSDIGMPGESGYDLIKRVRELPPEHGGNVPAAALTAYARPEDRRKVLGAGFMMHVPKPVDPAELVAVVAALARIAPMRA